MDRVLRTVSCVLSTCVCDANHVSAAEDEAEEEVEDEEEGEDEPQSYAARFVQPGMCYAADLPV